VNVASQKEYVRAFELKKFPPTVGQKNFSPNFLKANTK